MKVKNPLTKRLSAKKKNSLKPPCQTGLCPKCGRPFDPDEHSRSRPPLERIEKIYELIRTKTYPNCTTLAEKLEISPATAQRDLDFMFDRMNLPMAYDPQRHGWKFTKRVGKLRAITVSDRDLYYWGIIEQYVRKSGTPLSPPMRALINKIARMLSPNAKYAFENLEDIISFRPFGSEIVDAQRFEAISNAIEHCRAVKCMYRRHNSDIYYERLLFAYHLANLGGRWYVLAATPDHAEVHKYVLGRVDKPEITKEKFKRPADLNLDAILNSGFRAMGGDKEYQIIIDLDRAGTDDISGRFWHRSQKLVTNPDGSSRMTMVLNSIEEIAGWVLSYGEHATVIAPPELIARTKMSGKAIYEKY